MRKVPARQVFSAAIAMAISAGGTAASAGNFGDEVVNCVVQRNAQTRYAPTQALEAYQGPCEKDVEEARARGDVRFQSRPVMSPEQAAAAAADELLEQRRTAELGQAHLACQGSKARAGASAKEWRNLCVVEAWARIEQKYRDLRRQRVVQQNEYDEAVSRALAPEREAATARALEAWRQCLRADVASLDDNRSSVGELAYALQNSCIEEYDAFNSSQSAASNELRQNATRQVVARLVLEHRARKRSAAR